MDINFKVDLNRLEDAINENQQTRKYITDFFDEWGVPYADSHTNFLYYPIDRFEQNGDNFRAAMKKANILCPPFQHEKTNYSRMTIRTQEEMEKVVTVLRKLRV